jgi:hypothetical protein
METKPIATIAENDFGSTFAVNDRLHWGDCGRAWRMLESLRSMFAGVRKCPNMNAWHSPGAYIFPINRLNPTSRAWSQPCNGIYF